MWMALHAYRRSPAGAEMMHSVATHIEAAYNVLGGLLPGSEGDAALEANPRGKSAAAGSAKPRANNVSKKGRSIAERTAKKAVDATKVPRKGDLLDSWGRLVSDATISPSNCLREHRETDCSL